MLSLTGRSLIVMGVVVIVSSAAVFLFGRRQDPTPAYFVGAIVVSSLVSGVGHLPVAYLILPEVTVALTLFVIVANSIFGLIAGYLYWRRGLESAMLAHMVTHVLLLTASYFGAYF